MSIHIEDNRRTEPRYKIVLNVSIKGIDRYFNAKTEDISLTGMFLRTVKNIPMNRFIEMEIEIQPTNTKIEVLGKVVHKIAGYGLGIQFIEYKDNAKKMIATIIEYARSISFNEI